MENKLSQGERLRQLAIELKTSIRNLSKIGGISEATLYHITDGSLTISPRTAAKLCYHIESELGIVVNRDWLLNGTGDMIDYDNSAPISVACNNPQPASTDNYQLKYYQLLEQYNELLCKYTNLLESRQS